MANRLGWYLPEQLILKITLSYSEPEIWRRVEVDSGLTLHDLHFVIQNVLDWTNSHLYQFFVPPDGKLTRKARQDAWRYHVLPEEFAADQVVQGRRADEAMLGRILTPQCMQIVYEYDFGDSWEHLIQLETRSPGGGSGCIPRCIAGESPAPLEDSGGVPGYYDRIEALRDKTNPMHEETIEWLGKDFKPSPFDLAKVNRRLRAAFKPARNSPRKARKRR